MPPIFLTLDEALEIHRDQIERYGGEMGIRDLKLLQSALAAPAASFDGQYLHRDLFEMAAAYMFHIVSNHPFIDGNKRAGAVAALVFLSLNHIEVDTEQKDFERMVFDAAKGRGDKAAIAGFLRENTRKK